MSFVRVTKLAGTLYGRTKLPANGHITHTAQDNLRITPKANGIPAQALVEWDDGEVTWERLRDITRRRFREVETK